VQAHKLLLNMPITEAITIRSDGAIIEAVNIDCEA